MFTGTQNYPVPNGCFMPHVVDPRPTFTYEGTRFMSGRRDWHGGGLSSGQNGDASGWNGSAFNGHGQAGGVQ
jgi:hypothetical protein